MTFVDPPPGTASRFGLLEAASVVQVTDPHALMGVEWTPLCGEAHLTTGACVDPVVTHGEGGDVVVPKTPTTGIPDATGEPFAVYHLFQCRPVGIDLAARARASFEQAEQIAVEEWFGAYLTVHTAAVDITPVGDALPPVAGLAALEAYAGAHYGGTPVLHGDRGLASVLLAAGSLIVNGGRLETRLGARFAAGGGYASTLGNPDGNTETSDEEGWLYATGPVGFWRGAVLDSATGIELVDSPPQVASAQRGVADSAVNLSSVLVERPYVGGTSCLVVGCRIERDLCCEEGVLQ